MLGGIGGGDENVVDEVSSLRMASREKGASQGGGRMLARRWRFKSIASHKGSCVRYGGWRGAMEPFITFDQ